MTSPHRSTRATGEHTRSALLTAAVQAIVRDGWLGAGARSVTSLAGVPLGALNYHFDNKEALFRAASMSEVTAMFATPWKVMATAASVQDLVTGMVTWSRSPDVTTQQQVTLLEVMTQSRRDPLLSAALDEGLGRYRREMAIALHRLEVVPSGPTGEPTPAAVAIASAFASHCNGLFLQFMIEPSFPNDAAAAESITVWLQTFGDPAPAPRA